MVPKKQTTTTTMTDAISARELIHRLRNVIATLERLDSHSKLDLYIVDASGEVQHLVWSDQTRFDMSVLTRDENTTMRGPTLGERYSDLRIYDEARANEERGLQDVHIVFVTQPP